MLLKENLLIVDEASTGGVEKCNEIYGTKDWYIPYRMLRSVIVADKLVEFILINETSYVVEIDEPHERYALVGCLSQFGLFSIHHITDYQASYILLYGREMFVADNYLIVFNRTHGEVYTSIPFPEIEYAERDKATGGLFIKLRDDVGKSYYTNDFVYRQEIGCGYLWTFLDAEEVDGVISYINDWKREH